MADLSRKTASIYINHAPAEEALKKLQTQADKLSTSIKKGEDAGKNMVKEIAKLNSTKEQIAGVQKQIDQGLKPSFNQLQSLVAKTRAELKKMSESDPGFTAKAKELNKYSTEMNRLGTQIGAVKKESGGVKEAFMGMLPAIGLAAAGAAVIGFLRGAVNEALEADKAAGRLQGTLDNLGKGDAFGRLADRADAMAERFKFLDNDDVIGVFEKLITYGKLTEAQMNGLIPVIIDFAAKSRISVDESASVIIKALEGNGKALKEYGIDLKDAKTDSERLAVVMGELKDKVNGAADAFGKTTPGAMAATTQSIANLKEEIGTGLLPAIHEVLGTVAGLVTALNRMYDDGIAKVFSRVKDGFVALVTGGDKAFDELNKKRNAVDPSIQMNNIAEGIAMEVGQKKIAEQQKLADAYKNVFINARKELAEFRNSADKNDKEKADKLAAQVEQKGKIFLATQRTLNESIAQEKKNADKIAEEDAKKSADKAGSKREEATRKALDDAKRLRKIWEDLSSRINDPSALMSDDPVSQAFNKANVQAAKDTAQAKMLLDKKVIDYKTYSDSIVRIEEIRMKALQDIAQKYKLQTGNASFVPGQATTLAQPISGGKLADNSGANQQLVADRNKTLQNDMAGVELKILTSTGKKKLQAQLAMMEFQRGEELKNKNLTEGQKAVIEEQWRQKRKAAEQSYNFETAQMVVDAAQQVSGILSMFNAAANAADEEKLNQVQKNYDEDKNKLDRQLRQKVVSQKEYDRQLKALDDKKRKEDAVIKKREFERNKQAQIIDAIMGGANAVISALKAPWPLNFIMAGIATAMVAAQVATISSQKAPQYAKGGLLDGPRHSQGGMPVLNRAGQKVAEVEGGEAILSRKTVKNNLGLVNQLLRASMYGNGAPITPYWKQRPAYKPINYSGISNSMDRVRYFEKGGIIPGPVETGINNQNDSLLKEVVDSMNNLNRTVDNLNLTSIALHEKLGQPFKSYTLLSDINANQDIMDRIIKETTITRK